MSGIIGGYATDNNAISLLIANAGAAKARLDTLTGQASTGLVGTTFAGLGAGAAVALDLGPQLTHQQVWEANIDAATGRMQVTQTAMQQLGQIAASFYAKLNNLNGLDASTVDSVAASARDALVLVAGLLDSTDGGVYVFAGQDSANPPVPNPDAILSSGFYTQINAAVSGLAGAGPAATIGATLAVGSANAAGTSPFSGYLSQPAAGIAVPTVEIGFRQRASIGLVASANASVASTGSSTTGSYMRDLLRGLATIGSLTSGQLGAAGFPALVADTRAGLSSAITAMSVDVGVLGDRQTALAAQKTVLAGAATALAGQVSAVQDVDMAKTLSSLSLTQTQLQASYQMIAAMKSQSLVNYL